MLLLLSITDQYQFQDASELINETCLSQFIFAYISDMNAVDIILNTRCRKQERKLFTLTKFNKMKTNYDLMVNCFRLDYEKKTNKHGI